MSESVILHQLFEAESSTYTYLLVDPESFEAVLIDPVLEMLDRDLKLIEELNAKLVYVLDTHVHADHITAANELRKRSSAKTAISEFSGVDCADLLLHDGQELTFGSKKISCISTPGHTKSCMTYYIDGMLFTGDALLIRACGRTDFQEGSVEQLYDSVHNKLYRFPDDTKVYPGHDYKGFSSSTIGMEKKYNSRLSLDKSKSDFVNIMANLKLANPKKIQEAVPANLACGKIPS